jgi:hypothetical protein
VRATLASWFWSLSAWLGSRRRPVVREQDVQKHVYRDQTRSIGVRMTEWLRDRLRPRWLRVRRDDAESGGS